MPGSPLEMGTLIANSWEDLTDGTLQNPIVMTETMELPQPSTVWTNTNPDGSRAFEGSCDNWSSDEPSSESFLGRMSKADEEWTKMEIPLGCDIISHLYCFEQG